MIIYLFSRIICSTAAFLYPGYKSYKALSKRGVDEAELERWLMYWTVMGFISAFEYVAEWLIRWIPFYYLFKTMFLLFLALPQTQGSTFIYSVHLAPILRGHEEEIDSALAQLKLAIYEFIQDKLRAVWNQVAGGVYATNANSAPSVTDIRAVNPPSMADPLSGAAQLVSGWWNTYAPAIAATGAAYIATRQQAAEATAKQRRPEPPMPAPSAPSTNDRASVLARRRALEAELAALPQVSSPSPTKTAGDSHAGDSNTSGLSSSSSYELHTGEARRRKGSGSDGEEDARRYETIAKEDIGSGSEDNSSSSKANPRSSWWGWRTSSYQGYEPVKTD